MGVGSPVARLPGRGASPVGRGRATAGITGTVLGTSSVEKTTVTATNFPHSGQTMTAAENQVSERFKKMFEMIVPSSLL